MRCARTNAGILCVSLLLLANCGDGGEDTGAGGNNQPISSQNLSGKIGGQPWSFMTGQTDSFLSDATKYFTTLYPSAFTACQTFAAPGNDNYILIDLPASVGSYGLSLSQNATLYDASTSYNWVATRGRIQIDSITETTITGGVTITYNADNAVDGQFQASICP